jgi:signal transduction histidine kinase
LAHRITALRNLPFIVVSNPSVNKIYNNYLHSLSTLEPFYQKEITTIEDEQKFTEIMADLVRTHSNTIPILANGFLQCRKYIDPNEVTRFLDQHLRARIGTRLVAEQHLALHVATTDHAEEQKGDTHVGVIDMALRPAEIIQSCQNFVSEICELKYGVRPTVVINGDPEAEFAHIPMHLEYIVTELLKNAFRATIESGNERTPIEITIAAAPDVPTSGTKLESLKQLNMSPDRSYDFSQSGLDEYCADPDMVGPLNHAAPFITIRIRDRGGGIAPETLPNIWSYSFTTFDSDEAAAVDNGTSDGLNALSESGDHSTIAGLGYGLPLSRAYAEYFAGGIAVQSMHGWGTDVYLTLQGVGKVS